MVSIMALVNLSQDDTVVIPYCHKAIKDIHINAMTELFSLKGNCNNFAHRVIFASNFEGF